MTFEEGDRVLASHLVPNPVYRGHSGRVIKILYEKGSQKEIAEVSWDEPFPLPDSRYKIIPTSYLELLPVTNMYIQELP